LNTLSSLKLGAVCCGLLFVGLAGCASPPPSAANGGSVIPTEHYAVKVENVPDQVALAVHAEGISAHQGQALVDFVARWREAGAGVVTLRIPADAKDTQRAQTMGYSVQSRLEALGIGPGQIQLESYVAGVADGPLIASFQHLAAHGDDCNGDWGNLTSTMGNEPYKHFGCALTANFAAQLADPRDLVAPVPLSAGDTTRREVVLSKYREGQTTSSAKDDQASGAASTVVK
jgi:pilus assembly protein CpaD